MKKIFFTTLLLLFLFSNIKSVSYALEPIDFFTIDETVHTYATFGSYNQHVIKNQYGIFIAYKKTQLDEYDLGAWRLAISRDGGQNFASLGEATQDSKPPALETDASGNVYLATGGTNPLLCVYRPSQNFANPTCVNIPNSSSGKFSLLYDPTREQLYYFSHYAVFSIFDTNLNLKNTYQLGDPNGGSSAYWQYPLLAISENGKLVAAWTTVKKDQYLYWSIHTAVSNDGGSSWAKLDGTPLSLPLIPDETGPTDRITLDDEFYVHTWLKQLFIKNNIVYYPYTANFPQLRYHIPRYSLGSGQKIGDAVWNGANLDLSELHGFCASKSSDPNFPIYCVSKGGSGKINVTVSYDQGATWRDYATGNHPSDTNPWSITGFREITDDNYLIGIYTNQNNNDIHDSDVRFFRVKVAATSVNPPPTPTPLPSPSPLASPPPIPSPVISPTTNTYIAGDLNQDNSVDLLDFNILLANFGSPYTIFDFNAIVSNYGQ